MEDSNKSTISSVYGPVNSWRIGKSLGIDLLMDPSTCSFNCIYCQLGSIQNITTERKIYVPTEKVLNDLMKFKWHEVDAITFSGSGEPTLALNLGEAIEKIKKLTDKKIIVLTNATLFNDQSVRKDILLADLISAKLDTTNDKELKMINRPAQEVNFENIIKGIKNLKKEINELKTKPLLQIQIMFTSYNPERIKDISTLLNEITPDEVALNTPTRPYPSGWDITTRGAHGEDIKKIKFPLNLLKQLTEGEALNIENQLRDLTGLKILSVYGNTKQLTL